MIMGMSGTALHWGEPFLEPLRRDFEVIVYDHRGVGASSRWRSRSRSPSWPRTRPVCSRALELDSAHVAGHLDGRDDRPGARARPSRAVRTLTLGCTYCGGEGSSLAGEDVMRRLAEGMPRATASGAARRLGGQRLAGFAADAETRTPRFHEIALKRAVAVPVIMAQMQAITATTRSRACPGDAADARRPRHADEMLPSRTAA
jgi:3-oxoadipate enol-lactonase